VRDDATFISAPKPIGRRILITGGTGFIGTALANALCDNNEVILFDQRLTGTPWAIGGRIGHPNVRIVLGDILDERLVRSTVEEADMVLHLAAIVGVNKVRSHPRETIETNFLGTQTVLRAAEKVPDLKRFVYFSTSEVFGVNSYRVEETMATSVGPVQETRWSYSISKLAGEHLLQCYHRGGGMPTVTIRPFNVFGPNRTGDHAMLRFIVNAMRDRDIVVHGSGDQIRSWCYIDDFCAGVLASLVVPEAIGEDFNLGNPRNTLTIFDLAKRVVSLTGSRSSVRLTNVDYADVDLRVPRPEKARRMLGFTPRIDIEEGIARTAAWCGAHLDLLDDLLARAEEPVCGNVTAPTKTRVEVPVISELVYANGKPGNGNGVDTNGVHPNGNGNGAVHHNGSENGHHRSEDVPSIVNGIVPVGEPVPARAVLPS
jgi:nucleoside-diphosphate-sugar epimerase